MRPRARDAGKESQGSKRNILTLNVVSQNKLTSPGLGSIYSDQSYPDSVSTPHGVVMLIIPAQERMLHFRRNKTEGLERCLYR